MRFYHRIALALVLIYLFGDDVLGAPTTGRYHWVKCRPDDKNPNCAEKKGPLVKIAGLSSRLPPSATKDIVPVESSEETVEQSGDGSGDIGSIFHLPALSEEWMNDGMIQEAPQTEDLGLEEGSGEINYTNYVSHERMKPQLSEDDLKQDNMIQ